MAHGTLIVASICDWLRVEQKNPSNITLRGYTDSFLTRSQPASMYSHEKHRLQDGHEASAGRKCRCEKKTHWWANDGPINLVRFVGLLALGGKWPMGRSETQSWIGQQPKPIKKRREAVKDKEKSSMWLLIRSSSSLLRVHEQGDGTEMA